MYVPRLFLICLYYSVQSTELDCKGAQKEVNLCIAHNNQ